MKKIICMLAACVVLCMAGALAGCGERGRDDALFCQDTVKQIALGDSPEEVGSVLGEPYSKGSYLQNGMFLIETYEYYDSAYAALLDEYLGDADEAEGRSESEGRGEDLQDRLENTPYRFICVEFSGGSVRSVLLDRNRGLDAHYGFDVGAYRSTLKKVTLADGTWLDGSAFEGFPVLEELVCGEGVYLDFYCFEGCPLRRVTATAYHFAELPKADLEEVTVTEGELTGGLFLNCKSLKRVTLEEVSSIGLGAFRGCEALESVYFAETEGWTADGEPIDPAVLADPAAAAKALTETYADYVLERK